MQRPQRFHELFRRSLLLALLLALVVMCVPGCPPTPTPGPGGPGGGKPVLPPPISQVKVEPMIRVRVVRDVRSVTLDGATTLSVGPASPAGNDTSTRDLPAPVTISRVNGSFVVQGTGAAALSWNLPAIEVRCARGAEVRADGVPYPGAIVLQPDDATTFDVVNHVPLEQYLPGVLDGELYPSWHPEMFRAQAIAARSYAIATSARNVNRTYDMENTTASQMYHGAVNNAKANEAVRSTRGLVLTYQDRVIPAYYSSTAGDTGQDAAIAFQDGPDIPPLRGRVLGGWDAQSPHFRWGPITRARTDIVRRLAGWGAANRHEVAKLRDLSQIMITRRNEAGRPAQFTILDNTGRQITMRPEEFRFACNFAGGGLPALPKEAQLKSSNVQVRVTGAYVQFYDGRGLGHGVGMSQFGAQAMALQGYTAASIVAFYYPQSKLERAY